MKSEKKRLISFILAVLMVSSLAAPALADVFALVELSSPETEPLVAATPEGDLTVTVRYGPDAGIPDGSTLAVTPVDEEEKSKYMESGLSVIGGGKAVLSRFVDIKIVSPDGEEVHPGEGKYVVLIDGAEEVPEGATLHVVHFEETPVPEPGAELIGDEDVPVPSLGKKSLRGTDLKAGKVFLKGEADGLMAVKGDGFEEKISEEPLPNSEVGLTPVEITEVEQNDGRIAFVTPGFSVFGLIYTVDFHWDVDGQSYEYRIPGGGCISLTDLLTALRIGGEDINSFENGIEDVSFSNPELVWVGRIDEDTTVGAIKEAFGLEALCSGGLSEEQINDQTVEAGDWAVISILPFDSEETLTVAMKNGERFEIRVTDDAGQTVSSSLVDFLTNVTIIAPTNELGQYVIDPGTEYTINMTFQEKPPRPDQTALQFSDSPLTYPIPNGILVNGASGSIDLQITRGNVVYTIHDNTFRVENGVLTFQFNTIDPNYRQLAACNNVCFTISIAGLIEESSNIIKFSDSIEKTIVIDDSNSVTTSKSAYVDIQNDKIVYTATVTSNGKSTDVVVTDTISGTALTLDPASIHRDFQYRKNSELFKQDD